MADLAADHDLLRQMRMGDAQAFTVLYRRYQAPLYRYALLRSGSEAVAADLVQEVFMGLVQGQYRFDPGLGQLQFFLFGVIRNLALKIDVQDRRFESRDQSNQDNETEDEVICEHPSPLQRLLHDEMAEELRIAIAALSPHYRDVLILFEIQELSYLEIAQICQINVGTVRSRLSRARQTLAQRLSDWQPSLARSA
ncbi:RNA polymerase sigma factor [Undibacterium sp. LX40W]|uniref:RNA polymerase sigma factor n=1 Tax=Undibacterium nitidum TaxID=2762298 RepID=A0A923KSI0_9BURK|nr:MULTISPECIES: RNA polymerase sigma factor [Undibacterium]MBC3880514.1 RNA polymerase sigma factor [Undibacterium nitidum]MBC3890750.1 RNA polymerase sigma factor [Undibacterium sp. LX40W]